MLNKFVRVTKKYFADSEKADPRWATPENFHQSKLLDPAGAMLAKSANNYLRAKSNEHVLVVGPCRSGKTAGVAIPTLLSYEDSVVVLDISQEKYDLTAGYRHDVLGQEVYIFSPLSDCGLGENLEVKSHRYNPLSSISDKKIKRLRDIFSIASVIWPSGGKDSFWNDSARNLFAAIVLFLLETRDQRENEGVESKLPDAPVNMSEVLWQVIGLHSEPTLHEYFANLLERHHFLSEDCVRLFNGFCSTPKQSQDVIVAHFTAALKIFRDPGVQLATSTSDFNLADIHKKKMSIYISCLPYRVDEFGLLSRLIYSELIGSNKENHLEEGNISCLLLMDDFTSIGKVDAIIEHGNFLLNKGLSLLAICQSTKQLEVVYGLNSQDILKGIATIKVLFKGYEDGFVPLISRQDLMGLDRSQALILTDHEKPILCSQIEYFNEQNFLKRLLPPPSIPALSIGNIKKAPLTTQKNSPEIHSSWNEHAHPLMRISIVAQCTRHGTRESLIAQLEVALKRLKEGLSNGCEHDDDFGYLFKTEEDLRTSVFGANPAGHHQ